MKRVVTFGELMLRLSPEGYGRIVQADRLGMTFGGAEANVAVSLANYGLSAAFVTKLPANELGRAALCTLRKYGVDVSGVVQGEGRLGIYFCEKGASQRPSKVIYDRAHSVFSEAKREEFDWDALLCGADWFHFTGITPALSPETAAICRDAVKTARAKGIPVSCDLNYRNNLWSKERAGEVMGELLQDVDHLIANEEDAKDVFGIEAEGSDICGGTLRREGYESVARRLAERFALKSVAITLRESFSASDNGWSAMLYSEGKAYFAPRYAVRIVDRVGGGDSFGGGLICALAEGRDLPSALSFATAASCLKHTVEGDFNLVTREEVERLAGGDGSGRVRR